MKKAFTTLSRRDYASNVTSPLRGPKLGSFKWKKNYFGFYTGDIVKANKPKGKGAGEHLGRLTVNSKPGNFVVNGVTCHAKYMRLIQRNDGWKYDKQERSDRCGRE